MSKKEEHTTYEDNISGLVFIPKKNKLKKTKFIVRYSKSNIADTASFSDNENFLVQFLVEDLKEVFKKYEETNDEPDIKEGK